MSRTQTIAHDRYEQLRAMGDELAQAGRRLWLAGLGAVGTVGETGWKWTAELVERGRKERPNFERRLRDGGERLRNLGRENAEKVLDLGREAERRLEERVAEAMRRFGVPSRNDVRELIERIEELTRKVETLSARS